MSEDVPPPEGPKPNRWVMWFVVGLPFGLLIMGAFSFVFYFHKRNAAKEIQPSKYSSMMRKELNLPEYERYLKVFGSDIGPRTTDQPGNIEAAQSFIQSTLGYDNMGYDVVRRASGNDVAFEAALPASQSPRQLVLVCARYDDTVNANGISALCLLAHALTGTTHKSNIRFLAFNGPEIHAYKDWNAKEDFTGIMTLWLGDHSGNPPTLGGHVLPLPAPEPDDPTALETLQMDQELIEKFADAPEPIK